MLLPVARRTFTDPSDDITEELSGLEFAAPGLLYDPMLGMAQTGAMLMGDMPVNPNVMTQTMLDAPLVSGLLGAATGAAPKGTLLGANVFHGGPHRFAPEPDFPHGRPRLDKIGTGEGNQAYGYGFYSADAPGVAKSYADALGGKVLEASDGSILHSSDIPLDMMYASMEMGAAKTIDEAISNLSKSGKFGDEVKYLSELRDKGYQMKPGTLYKLDIPDADVAKYLDYDKPLSEQGEIGQRIKNLISKLETPSKAQSDADRALLDELGVELAEFGSEKFDPFEGVTGGQAYNYITELLGGSGSVFSKSSKGQQAASEALRKAGIPGLKYFDQDSRTRTARATIDGVSINKYKPQNGYEEYIISKFKSGVPFHEIKEIAAMRPEGDALLAKWELKVPEGTRNYVTWDQDVLDRSKMLERDGVTLGANKGPTAALPGLLDDTASRMQRARDMGFDVDNPVYHGTPDVRPINEMGFATPSELLLKKPQRGPYFFSKDRPTAATYADDRRAFDYQNAEPEVIKAFIKQENPLVIDAKGATYDGIDADKIIKQFADSPDKETVARQVKKYAAIMNGKVNSDQLAALASRLGRDGVVIKNVRDTYEGKGKPTDVFMVLGAENIRRTTAKFDPAKADSADLLAANPATAALPSLLQDRSGNIDQRGLLRRPSRNQNSFPMRSLLGQRVYTATMPDGSI